MPHFASPWLLLLLLLAPVLAWLSSGRRRRGSVRFSSRDLVRGVRPSWRVRLLWTLPLMHFLALVCLIVALARPQKGIGEVRTTADGIALMFVVDRSWSMNQLLDQRQQTTRIDVVKRLCNEFIKGNNRGLKGRPDDLIGLVTFGRFAETVCPLVRIHDTLAKLIDSIQLAHPQSVDAGTAIGEGLALAAARLRDAENELAKRDAGESDPEFRIKSKVIVLLTDGDENVTTISAPNAAKLCSEWGIKIYSVGIGGGSGMMTIQTPFGERQVPTGGGGFNEQLLNRIAEMTGSVYRSASNEATLDDIYREIDRLEKTEIHSKEYTSYEEQFVPWALAAASLLALEMLLSSTLLRRVP